MTKPVTAVTALTLVEEGRLQLLDNVATYLPALADVQVSIERDGAFVLEAAQRQMTVQDLFRHTAGFTYGFTGDTPVHRAYRAAGVARVDQTNAEMIEVLARMPLRFHPGTTFEYGMSIDVLGAVIEAVTGAPLRDVVAERVGTPLGWRDNGFRLTDPSRLAEAQIDPATGARPDLRMLYDPAVETRWDQGGGGMFITANEYLCFAQMLLDGGRHGDARVLGGATVRHMTSDHLPPGVAYGPFTRALGITAPLPEYGQGFGLGVAVRTHPGRNPSAGSLGDFTWPGISGTYWWADPSEDLAVVLLLQAPLQRVHYRCVMRDLVYAALR
jgi:CubicO group peptidase (beta-lactamase class C family)